MFDPNADIMTVISAIEREAFRRAVAKIAARNEGLAFVDLHLEEQPPFEFLEAA